MVVSGRWAGKQKEAPQSVKAAMGGEFGSALTCHDRSFHHHACSLRLLWPSYYSSNLLSSSQNVSQKQVPDCRATSHGRCRERNFSCLSQNMPFKPSSLPYDNRNSAHGFVFWACMLFLPQARIYRFHMSFCNPILNSSSSCSAAGSIRDKCLAEKSKQIATNNMYAIRGKFLFTSPAKYGGPIILLLFSWLVDLASEWYWDCLVPAAIVAACDSSRIQSHTGKAYYAWLPRPSAALLLSRWDFDFEEDMASFNSACMSFV